MDPHFAHLAEGNARQARKRVAADLLLRDPRGWILLVDPTYKQGWDLPGGMIEDNESPHDGVRREIAEELRLDIIPGRPLVVEWNGAHGPWDDQINFVFDGGMLTDSEIEAIAVGDDEIAAWKFFQPHSLEVSLRPKIRHRIELACQSLASDRTVYREQRTAQCDSSRRDMSR